MIELMLMQHTGPQAYFRKADEYLALYPDDYQTIGRLSSNQWHQRNDFRAAEALSLPVGSEVAYLRRVRSIDGEPVAVLENHLLPEFGARPVEQFGIGGRHRLLPISFQESMHKNRHSSN